MKIKQVIIWLTILVPLFSEEFDSIQSNYLDSNNKPSHKIFLEDHGISKQNTTIKLTPYFSVSFSKNDLVAFGKELPKLSAKPLNLDFYLKHNKKYESINRSEQIWDGRVYKSNNEFILGGYSSKYNEQPVGVIDEKGHFTRIENNSASKEFPVLDIPDKHIVFDPFEKKLLQIQPSQNNRIEENSKSFLPLELYSKSESLVHSGQYDISYNSGDRTISLFYKIGSNVIEIARSRLNKSTITNKRDGYQPELIAGATQLESGNTISFEFEGSFTEAIKIKGDKLFLTVDTGLNKIAEEVQINKINLDGDFMDWRNTKGMSDPESDYISYLFPNPDTDLLDFKVTNDDTYLYFYSRVVGAHGRTGEKGRYYWYTYIDVDMNSKTGYPPTRDDNCYFGIDIGDDSEAQFEFIGNKFIKTFFGFTGIGAEKEVLDGDLMLGPSFYSSKDKNNKKRNRYKVEYVHRDGIRSITHDYTEGSSEDINIALSPDGSEVEMRVELKGFLSTANGVPILQKGQSIHIAVGVEASSDYYKANKWGADSSPVIYGYTIK